MDSIICLRLVLVVVFRGLVIVKHWNFCWLFFYVVVFTRCWCFFFFFYYLLLSLSSTYFYLSFSIANILVLIVPFTLANVTSNCFISLEYIVHINVFIINYQINLISFYSIWLFWFFYFMPYFTTSIVVEMVFFFFLIVFIC